jgi:hypothetical protein
MSWELEDTLDRDTGSCNLAPGPVRARADRQQHEPSRASSVDGRTENAGWQACELLKQSEQACSLETIRCGPAELRQPVPRSAAAIVQAFTERTKNRARRRWHQSKQHAKMSLVDKTLPSNNYLKLMKHMTRRQSSLLIRLRTGHSPLNRHLWAIKVADSPGCNACGRDEEETVRHFLISCPAHENARTTLRNQIGARNAGNIPLLLTHRKFLRPLFKFVDSTGQFRELLGTITGDEFNRTIYD